MHAGPAVQIDDATDWDLLQPPLAAFCKSILLYLERIVSRLLYRSWQAEKKELWEIGWLIYIDPDNAIII